MAEVVTLKEDGKETGFVASTRSKCPLLHELLSVPGRYELVRKV
jgi:hypothetical protein